MSAIDRLRTVAEYAVWTRRVGHTTMLLRGVTRCLDHRPVVLVSTTQEAAILRDEIRDSRVTFLAVDQLDSSGPLRGMQRPLWIDPAALHTLVEGAISEMQTIVQRARVEEIERQAARLRTRTEPCPE